MSDVIAIVGPTASGKTALSIALAEAVDGEIINGDSMQVYQQLNIGTAKVTEEEKRGIPHHLFDILPPDASFSVSDYQRLVRATIDDIQSRQKTPIIVGGTGLYVQAVLYDFRFTEEAHDVTIRAFYERLLQEKGRDALYAELVKKDPVGAANIHPNNTRRIVRALEIIEMTGKSKREHENNRGHRVIYPHTMIGLDMERSLLYERINERVDQMIKEGLEREVRQLYESGLRDAQSMTGIGYKEWIPYFDGDISYDDVVETLKRNTRRYAKRQLTYFRNKLSVTWLDAMCPVNEKVEKIVHIIGER